MTPYSCPERKLGYGPVAARQVLARGFRTPAHRTMRKPLDRPGRWIQISVKAGDTIPKRASKYGMSWSEIEACNPGISTRVRVGKMLWVWEGSVQP